MVFDNIKKKLFCKIFAPVFIASSLYPCYEAYSLSISQSNLEDTLSILEQRIYSDIDSQLHTSQEIAGSNIFIQEDYSYSSRKKSSEESLILKGKNHAVSKYQRYQETIDAASKDYNISLELILAVIGSERSGEKSKSPTGALGLMQSFNPAAFDGMNYTRRKNIDNKLTKYALQLNNIDMMLSKDIPRYKRGRYQKKKKQLGIKIRKNTELNLISGIAYIATLYDNYPEVSLTVASYQLGPGNVGKLLSHYKSKHSKRDSNISMKKYIVDNNITVYTLLNDKSTMRLYNRMKKRDRYGKYYELETYAPRGMQILRNIQKEKTKT